MRFSVSWHPPGGSASWKRLGEAVLSAPFTARLEFPDDHTVELEIDVEQGVPVCESIRVERNPTRPSLTGGELRRMPLKDWVSFAVAEAALMVRARNADGSVTMTPTSPEEAGEIERDAGTRMRRRTINEELLRDVARVYRANVDNRPREAVTETFTVAPATAARYIKLAREQGFLGQAPGPGKAGEA